MPRTNPERSLDELLPLAIKRRALDNWTVDGRYFLFQRGTCTFHVHPVVAVEFLSRLIGDDVRASGQTARQKPLRI